MCQRSIFSRSCIRIAEEVQLQAEEEWILGTLKKIKQQRNCLQIERLHLESLKAQLKNTGTSADEKEQSTRKDYSKQTTPPPCRRTELMSAVDMMTLGSMRQTHEMANSNDDTQCNNQELNLNLNVSGPCFNVSQRPYQQCDYGSDDDSMSDISDGDNVKIDINMLMNGNENCTL